MIVKPKQQDIDLWEAWIEMQSSKPADGGTLYIIGDVFMNTDLVQPSFIKRESPGDPHALKLEIYPGSTYNETFITEIMYAEDLDDVNHYNIIEIYEGDELVKTIRDIEKML
jgi:hypothetical protein